ncbi:hypothetical protein F8M41_021273 [Gigaspora margarita]|uniref:Uncharacterized protein n=1 Tax=Gigaspora margarita TaxID=4874 RepID=A0A8H4AH28_GIGMA|nr:hypothetical protein F8M41_021273 [Gigaspora margarita]
MSSSFSLIVRISCPLLHTFRSRVYLSPTYSIHKRSLISKTDFRISSREETGLIRISPSASKFLKEDLEALKIVFRPASSEDAVIPAVNIKNYPKKYEVPEIDPLVLSNRNFNVNNYKVSDVLVQVADMDGWPFKLRHHPFCELVIGGKSVTARPEFVIDKDRIAVVIDDKHLKNRMLTKRSDYGEVQLAAEILACGSANLREIYEDEYVDQEIFAIRVISTYFTFYRTVITASYWEELDFGLPKKQLVVIERWPPKNGKDEGLDIAEIGGRKVVLTSLAKIREYLLQ